MLSSLRSPEGEEIMGDFASRGFGGIRVLPARLARLTRDFAIIFVGESFLAAAASVPAARTARTAAAGFRFRTGFIHFQIAAADVFAVERRDGFRCFSVVRHFHETEAARAAGLAIGGDVHTRELAERLEERAEIFRGGLKAHVANKQILHGDSPEHSTTVASAIRPAQNPKLILLSCHERKKD